MLAISLTLHLRAVVVERCPPSWWWKGAHLAVRGDDEEGALQLVVDRHDRRIVVKLAAVVGRREDRHELAAREEAVAALHHLVRAHDEVHVHHVQKVVHDVLAEEIAHAAVAFQKALYVVLRVGPQQVAQDAAVRHIAGALNVDHGRHRRQVGAQPAVHTDDLLADHAAHRHRVEHVREGLEEPYVVAPLHVVEEAVGLINRRALVVAAEQKEVLRVDNLVTVLQNDGLDAVLAAVHVVSEEEIVRVGGEPALLVDAQQVVVLPMGVATDAHRRPDLQQHRLLHEDLAHRVQHRADLFLFDEDLSLDTVIFDSEHLLYQRLHHRNGAGTTHGNESGEGGGGGCYKMGDSKMRVGSGVLQKALRFLLLFLILFFLFVASLNGGENKQKEKNAFIIFFYF
ncbi:protein phosphatase [Strigomonas culicis]|uniref:Protein phosphatase n=1 Tax=Strigomonas culicis TaxID=28005 RepID=S9W778_9TRYP|nr:protein phosphatase [Strigomonas culicis]|eukprot:EPY31835.1 protein phosphatase [Strigomonas culicis]